MKAIIRIRWDLPWVDQATKADRFPERLTADWQAERRRLFDRYTLPSLHRQTHRDWFAALLCDRANFAHHKPHASARVGWTYDAGSLARELAQKILLLRIDSDDILAPEALDLMMHSFGAFTRHVQLAEGVAWHEQTRTLYQWINPSPPFYGRMVSAHELTSGLPGLGHHGKIRALPDTKIIAIGDPLFCVVLHGGNVSNSAEGSWAKEIYHGQERARLIERFGL